jgi:nucleotide-binding universal stress UspA family protein
MTKIKAGSVVVGVDGSAHSDAAIAWAVGYAALENRPLVIVNAIGRPAVGDLGDPAEARKTVRMAARRVADHALGLARRMAPGLEIDVTTPVGDARSVLLDLADHASMIVVGTRGHGPVASLLLGSVSIAVASHAPCAVAVVRPREEPAPGGVVVGVAADGSDSSAIEFAAAIASDSGCPLELVHGWHSDEKITDLLNHEQRQQVVGLHESLLADTTARLIEKFPGLQVSRHMSDQSPVKAIVERSAAADCVVVGSRRRSGVRAFLGSVSRGVIEHAHCTVVVLRNVPLSHLEI